MAAWLMTFVSNLLDFVHGTRLTQWDSRNPK